MSRCIAAGKSGFGFGITPSTHVHLEKKSLDDVLGKMAAEKKLRQEQEGKGQPMFVFGSKISDRVVKEEKDAAASNGTVTTEKGEEDSKPKTAEELFKSAAQQDKPQEQHDFIAEAKEAAEKKKEHEKPSTSIVTVTTGEENDVNIFQTACKLHSFDKEKKAWVERGLAHIRINQRNEDGEVHHRIVARTTGNHRVVINSRVHADMFFERVDQKRLKISATTPDSNAMQIFLVTIGFSAEEEPGAEKVAKMNIHDETTSNKDTTPSDAEAAGEEDAKGSPSEEQKDSEDSGKDESA
ncbi:RanBP1 domain protein [Teladorsagia circumcincta]|uniref:RanBP1 domain protein n=1 Tax=Teladorsagia circumcincta TaxID=45464 RepID=A0A2G9V250_TELCI|nr:RanBP1 domain protein [Teladorsagia circumcincta]